MSIDRVNGTSANKTTSSNESKVREERPVDSRAATDESVVKKTTPDLGTPDAAESLLRSLTEQLESNRETATEAQGAGLTEDRVRALLDLEE